MMNIVETYKLRKEFRNCCGIPFLGRFLDLTLGRYKLMRHLKYLFILLILITSACTPLQAGTEAAGEPTVPSHDGEGNGSATLPTSLTNSQWKLVSFGEPGAETLVIEGSSITLEFDEEGQAGGSGGCNSYGTRYEAQGNTLSIEDVVSTLVACANEQVTEQEQQYFEALQAAAEYDITDDRLTIWYADRQGRLNFVQ
jgi:heat shock protein HslJ